MNNKRQVPLDEEDCTMHFTYTYYIIYNMYTITRNEIKTDIYENLNKKFSDDTFFVFTNVTLLYALKVTL